MQWYFLFEVSKNGLFLICSMVVPSFKDYVKEKGIVMVVKFEVAKACLLKIAAELRQ
ncbi:hypothetical protein KM914_12450 [Virgibacillus pantothenticus]|uniref:hypothetical protein n=1 Tax=Virgibacillus pantothenticus TaxID=1473 RepID=UPI001B38D8CD|nr:hypothetical protein [Virgibacillus pantothenticus]MBS7426580.1 hypothetical protein [Virgibacillus sp. 19R1-5]MBU8567235.1 hypothetical protein [Virgibacillus pantothenticus]MBU8642286.1 hypothetical protein [Virgibacillus pantothenticus]MEB5455823.1 hypothetical protein [Virgibacillus pantothenticus]MEB5468453.1 hypothetical protein [Virgibacillus pantothenticus]